MNKFIPQIILMSMLSLCLVSCQTPMTPSVVNKPAGFLGSYEQLELMQNKRTLYYEQPGLDLQHYNAIMIDPVRVFYLVEGAMRNTDEEDARKLSSYFHNNMLKIVAKKYQIVNDPGPNVLRVRAAIIDVKPTNVIVNVISKSLIYIPLDFGEAAIEGEIIDSMSQVRLVAIVDRKIGTLFSPSLGYTQWGHVKDTLRAWASQLNDVLTRLGMGQK